MKKKLDAFVIAERFEDFYWSEIAKYEYLYLTATPQIRNDYLMRIRKVISFLFICEVLDIDAYNSYIEDLQKRTMDIYK